MMAPSDRTLLDRFVSQRDEAAFRSLVGRHLDLVHGVAQRVTANDDLARDVAQNTFIRLARRAAMIPRGIELAAWLHRTSRSLAIDLVRSETRRKKREASSPNPVMETEPVWSDLAPVIDGLVDRLPAADREVVLLRFFQNQSHAAIATKLGLTEEAARKRSLRAIGKLRDLLGKQGIATTSTALAILLPAHAATPAPATLMTTVVGAAQGVAPMMPGGFLTAVLAMTKVQLGSIALAVVIFLASLGHSLSAAATARNATVAISQDQSATSDATSADRKRPQPRTYPENRLEHLEQILSIEGLAPRRRELISFLNRLSPAEFREVADYFHKSTRETDGAEYDVMLAAWAREDIENARAYVMEVLKGAGTQTVLQAWAQNDPQAALAWADSNPSSGKVNKHLIWVLSGIATEDVPTAVKRLEAMPDEKQRSDSALELFWAMDPQPSGIERLLAEIKDPALRTRIIAGAAPTLASDDPVRGSRLLASDPGAQELTDATDVYSDYYHKKPAEAVAMLDELPPGKMRNEAVLGIASYVGDPAARYALLEKFPDAATDRAISQLSWRFIEWDEGKALELVRRIADQAVRNDLLFRLLRYHKDWTTDPQTRRWLEENKIPVEVRDRLLKNEVEIQQSDEP
ncbi:RNA polymerase sigma factor [Luteolibacter soli]|uniref:RNA polymerase sigma factor n=1 Tax=Luteolibacter soli TaxID=3135280 RepID=A0ABU9AS79_9BACT